MRYGRIYTNSVKGTNYPGDLPMSEAEFHATLDPDAIIRNRASVGGPQPAEMERMLKASKQKLAQQGEWIKEKRARITSSLARLDSDFDKLMAGGR